MAVTSVTAACGDRDFVGHTLCGSSMLGLLLLALGAARALAPSPLAIGRNPLVSWFIPHPLVCPAEPAPLPVVTAGLRDLEALSALAHALEGRDGPLGDLLSMTDLVPTRHSIEWLQERLSFEAAPHPLSRAERAQWALASLVRSRTWHFEAIDSGDIASVLFRIRLATRSAVLASPVLDALVGFSVDSHGRRMASDLNTNYRIRALPNGVNVLDWMAPDQRRALDEHSRLTWAWGMGSSQRPASFVVSVRDVAEFPTGSVLDAYPAPVTGDDAHAGGNHFQGSIFQLLRALDLFVGVMVDSVQDVYRELQSHAEQLWPRPASGVDGSAPVTTRSNNTRVWAWQRRPRPLSAMWRPGLENVSSSVAWIDSHQHEQCRRADLHRVARLLLTSLAAAVRTQAGRASWSSSLQEEGARALAELRLSEARGSAVHQSASDPPDNDANSTNSTNDTSSQSRVSFASGGASVQESSLQRAMAWLMAETAALRRMTVIRAVLDMRLTGAQPATVALAPLLQWTPATELTKPTSTEILEHTTSLEFGVAGEQAVWPPADNTSSRSDSTTASRSIQLDPTAGTPLRRASRWSAEGILLASPARATQAVLEIETRAAAEELSMYCSDHAAPFRRLLPVCEIPRQRLRIPRSRVFTGSAPSVAVPASDDEVVRLARECSTLLGGSIDLVDAAVAIETAPLSLLGKPVPLEWMHVLLIVGALVTLVDCMRCLSPH